MTFSYSITPIPNKIQCQINWWMPSTAATLKEHFSARADQPLPQTQSPQTGSYFNQAERLVVNQVYKKVNSLALSLQLNIEALIHHQFSFNFSITAWHFQSFYFTGSPLAKQFKDLLIT